MSSAKGCLRDKTAVLIFQTMQKRFMYNIRRKKAKRMPEAYRGQEAIRLMF